MRSMNVSLCRQCAVAASSVREWHEALCEDIDARSRLQRDAATIRMALVTPIGVSGAELGGDQACRRCRVPEGAEADGDTAAPRPIALEIADDPPVLSRATGLCGVRGQHSWKITVARVRAMKASRIASGPGTLERA
jgi:hypothetical protein